MPSVHRHLAAATLIGLVCILAACVAEPETSTKGVEGLDMGQTCAASTDCSAELLCMSTRVGRICVQPCQDASECAEQDALCTPVPGVELGWCDAFENSVDEPPVDEPPVDEVPEDTRATYPEGPFGVSIGDVIENHAMVDSDGSPISLGDLRTDAAVKILLVFNTVAYCQGCAAKTAELTELQNELGSQGLLPIVALYENTDYLPAEADDALQYKRRLDLEFPVTADGEAVFQRYFFERAHPMILILDAEDMTILYKEISWQRSEVDAVLAQHL